jgi:hypothetical protein
LLLLPLPGRKVYANSTERNDFYLYAWFLSANSSSSSSNTSMVLTSSTVAVTRGVPAQVSVSCSGMDMEQVGTPVNRYMGVVQYRTAAGGAGQKQLIGDTAVILQPV